VDIYYDNTGCNIGIIRLFGTHTEDEYIYMCNIYLGCSQLLSSPLRTDLSFREQRHRNHHDKVSPFVELDIDMVRSFPLDYMHFFLFGSRKKVYH
jgi:hypothetical protein